MRILFLNVTGTLGGAERSLLDICASLSAADPTIEIHLLTAAPGPLLDVAASLGTTVSVLPMPAMLRRFGESGLRAPAGGRMVLRFCRQSPAVLWETVSYARALRRFVLDLEPDVVHSNSMKFHALTRLARSGGPAVVWHIRDFLSARFVTSEALRWAASECQAAVAISQAVAEDLRRTRLDVPSTVVYNAIDTAYFRPATQQGDTWDELAGLPRADAATVRVGLVATYARWKGQDVFLKAATELSRRAVSVPLRFYIIGGPIYETAGSQWSEKELRSLAEEVQPPVSVGFIPFQEDTAAIYRDLDIVVHASTSPEPFGRTIVEAMACARPVIVTQTGGAVELFEHEQDAIGVPAADVGALAAAIERLARDPQLRQRLSKCARESAVSKFDRARLGSQLLAVYNSVLERRERVRSS